MINSLYSDIVSQQKTSAGALVELQLRAPFVNDRRVQRDGCRAPVSHSHARMRVVPMRVLALVQYGRSLGGILFSSADRKACASFGAVEAHKRAGSRREPLRQKRGDAGAPGDPRRLAGGETRPQGRDRPDPHRAGFTHWAELEQWAELPSVLAQKWKLGSAQHIATARPATSVVAGQVTSIVMLRGWGVGFRRGGGEQGVIRAVRVEP